MRALCPLQGRAREKTDTARSAAPIPCQFGSHIMPYGACVIKGSQLRFDAGGFCGNCASNSDRSGRMCCHFCDYQFSVLIPFGRTYPCGNTNKDKKKKHSQNADVTDAVAWVGLPVRFATARAKLSKAETFTENQSLHGVPGVLGSKTSNARSVRVKGSPEQYSLAQKKARSMPGFSLILWLPGRLRV